MIQVLKAGQFIYWNRDILLIITCGSIEKYLSVFFLCTLNVHMTSRHMVRSCGPAVAQLPMTVTRWRPLYHLLRGPVRLIGLQLSEQQT